MTDLLEKLSEGEALTDDEWTLLIEGDYDRQLLYDRADKVRRQHYGTEVYIRGLIEISSFCHNDCYYCGIRKSNEKAERYRLSEEEIYQCCDAGYNLGFRTFVLQGGEDAWYTAERVKKIVSTIKHNYSDCAVTLSLGERARSDYEIWYQAGADRYLLRHETASRVHYGKLHPPDQSFDARMECLRALKEIGYQTGCGFMVGSPYQGTAELIADMRFLRAFQPHMVGIGPFIPHRDTPFAAYPGGTLEQTLTMLALIRLMLPYVLLPATTALGTIHPEGRELGLQAGANVVMPNLSPCEVRKKYSLYNNKICTDEEAAEGIVALRERIAAAGYEVVTDRGDMASCDKAGQ